MSVSALPSTRHSSHARSRKKCVSHKRRRNQNAEISELASLVPLSTFHGGIIPSSSITAGVGGDQTTSSSPSFVPMSSGCSDNSPGAADKLSVLRLTSTYLKLQQFMKEVTHVKGSDAESVKHPLRVIEEAIDGFLIVLDKEANILYVSETISDWVGLKQQAVLGQHLVDICHPSSAVEIRDGLKPSVTFPSSVPKQDDVFSQQRQFYVRFKSTVHNSRITSHTMIQVDGNLKVKLPPLMKTATAFVEPSVIGFIGECRRVESEYSALDMLFPLTSFRWTKNLDRKLIAIDETFKDVTGFDPEAILASSGDIGPEFVHPADTNILLPLQQYFLQYGRVVSPLFRALVKSGEWIWITIEVALRCKSGTTIPQFIEFKGRVLSQGVGKVKYAVQKETYIPPPFTFESQRLPDDIHGAIFLARFRAGAKLSLTVTGCTNCKPSNSTGHRDRVEMERGRKVDNVSLNSLPAIAAVTAADSAASLPSPSYHILSRLTYQLSDDSSSVPLQIEAVPSCGKLPRNLESSRGSESHFTGKQRNQGMLTQPEDETSSPVIAIDGVSCPPKLHVPPEDFSFQTSTDFSTSDGAFSEVTCSSFNSTSSLSCTDLSQPSYYSSAPSYYTMDPRAMATGTDFTSASAFDPSGQSDCQSSNVLSQEFNKFNSMTTTEFSTFPSHALLTSIDAPMHSSPEPITSFEESLPATQSLIVNPSDHVMQQPLSNIHVDGHFNFNTVVSPQHWNNLSTGFDVLEAGGNSFSSYSLSQEPQCHVSYLNTDQVNLEVQDILQQFM